MSKLSDREIFIAAVGHLEANFRKNYPNLWLRSALLGFDAEGILDIEFTNLFAAMEWAMGNNVLPIIDFRDPVAHPTNRVVLTVNLGDYARRFKLYKF